MLNYEDAGQDADLRAAPDQAFIDAIRTAYPVEPEIDRVLSRKMAHRAGPGYAPLALETLTAHVAKLIRAHIGDDFEILSPRWLGGGASKLQMAFELSWTPPGAARRQVDRMVLRMEPPEAIVETSRRREYEALGAVEGLVPVPRCHWVDADAQYLPYPGLIYAFAKGATKPAARPSLQVTGIGTNFGPDLRAKLAPQFVQHMAAILNIDDARLARLQSFAPVTVGSNESVIRQINWWRRVWEEDRPEEVPIVHAAARWLIANAPPVDRASLVHGDFRAGNFLFDEGSARISAWLDWELALIGDRHQDLTWTTGEHFGHFDESGTHFLASGLLPAQELFRQYEQMSGLTVDPDRLRYYRIFNDFVSCVHMLATAARVARAGKTHQDIVVGWLSMIGNVIAGKLRDSLLEVI